MLFKGFTFGVPKEILPGERRVAATPETVKKLTERGAQVIIENSAGKGSYFNDDEYRAAGAEILKNAETIFERSDILLKVKEPQFNTAVGKHETDMMRSGQCLIAFLHPAFPGNHEMVRALAARKVTSFTLDFIPRISRAQQMDALTSMSTVAGYKGMLLAACELPKFIPMIGTASGMIQPAHVFVIGAGVVGLQAVATAKRLGAVVHATDIRTEACEQAASVGAKVVDMGIPQEFAVGEGGYAKKLTGEWLARERENLTVQVEKSDIIILSALIPGKIAPVLITEDMVQSMQAGSVIVDIAIDQGGNCEITGIGETVVKHGVTILGIQNIPGTVPKSSTGMYAKNIYYFVENLIQDGSVNVNMDDEVITTCLLTRNGEIVHAGAREAMNL